MTDPFPTGELDRGRISAGPTDSLVERTLEFVLTELAAWRDDPDRSSESAEERLNAQLCKYLTVAASQRFPMVFFHHEEKQTGTRRVDISAGPTQNRFVGLTYHTIYNPFLVFEGKRLPAPATSREREYVTGSKKSGAIERFKLGLHGAQQTTAAIVAYVQSGDPMRWRLRINEWIRELGTKAATGGEKWSDEEQLPELVASDALGISSTASTHGRVPAAITPEIRIHHFWVVMQAKLD